jgi:hypothetical protein
MKQTWKGQRDYLCSLIKKLSDAYGGDDREWLRDYAREVVRKYATHLQDAIDCFESLIPKYGWKPYGNGQPVAAYGQKEES